MTSMGSSHTPTQGAFGNTGPSKRVGGASTSAPENTASAATRSLIPGDHVEEAYENVQDWTPKTADLNTRLL